MPRHRWAFYGQQQLTNRVGRHLPLLHCHRLHPFRRSFRRLSVDSPADRSLLRDRSCPTTRTLGCHSSDPACLLFGPGVCGMVCGSGVYGVFGRAHTDAKQQQAASAAEAWWTRRARGVDRSRSAQPGRSRSRPQPPERLRRVAGPLGDLFPEQSVADLDTTLPPDSDGHPGVLVAADTARSRPLSEPCN